MARRKVILYSAVSLDGFIAREDGNIDWLPSTDSIGDDDQDYKDFYAKIDVTLMGRKTYEQVLGFPGEFAYSKTKNYVFTRQQQPASNLVHFIHDHIEEFVNQLKNEPGKDIWLIGGAELNTLLLNANLIDELILTIIPTVLGKGIPLFGQQANERQFKYSNTKIFPAGYVQIKYTN